MDRHGWIDERLASVPLFANLDKKHLRQISSLATPIDVPEGKALTREGDIGHEFIIVLEELRGRLGDEDLTAVCRGHQPRGSVHGRPVIVAVAQLGLPGEQAHADAQLADLTPLGSLELELRVERGVERVTGAREDRVHAVARRLHDIALMQRDGITQDRVVTRERVVHRVGMLFPEPRRTFEVGEEEGDGPGGERNG